MQKATFRNRHGTVWWCNGFYMALLNTPSFNSRIASWKGSMLVAVYHYPDGSVRKQFSIPGEKLQSVIDVLSVDDQIGLF